MLKWDNNRSRNCEENANSRLYEKYLKMNIMFYFILFGTRLMQLPTSHFLMESWNDALFRTLDKLSLQWLVHYTVTMNIEGVIRDATYYALKNIPLYIGK